MKKVIPAIMATVFAISLSTISLFLVPLPPLGIEDH